MPNTKAHMNFNDNTGDFKKVSQLLQKTSPSLEYMLPFSPSGAALEGKFEKC